MEHPTFSVSTPIHQCPHCGGPVERPGPAPEIGGLPAIIREKTIHRIAQDVAARLGNVTAHEIMNVPRGGLRVEPARHEVMWRARDLRNPDGSRRFSLPQIGRAFMAADGGMDHTSIMNGCRNYERVIRAETVAKVMADNAASARLHGASR